MPVPVFTGDPGLVLLATRLQDVSPTFVQMANQASSTGVQNVNLEWFSSPQGAPALSGYGDSRSVWKIGVNRDVVAVLNNSRTYALEEMIAHELAHTVFQDPPGTISTGSASVPGAERDAVLATTAVSRELGLDPFDPDNGTLTWQKAYNYNDAGNPQADRDHVSKLEPKLFCFGAGVLISMADGSKKPIELIVPGDLVFAFDATLAHGREAPRCSKVVRLFRNHVPHILDFHGTPVTPGHSYLCGDGQWAGKFRSLIDILREDGAVVKADGTLMRAATGCDVGSRGDAFVDLETLLIGYSKLTGEEVRHVVARGLVRAGTILTDDSGGTYTLLDLLDSRGWALQADGKIVQVPGGEPVPLRSLLPALPKPEDYILTRSGLTLADLYRTPEGNEPPSSSWPLPTNSPVHATATGVLQASELKADAVPTSGGTPVAPGPSRRMRRKFEAEQRKRSGGRLNIGATMH